ncbi:MAG TPA: hypothetical protein VGD58_11820 [Herpetosiphonaceae bacterium]
MNRNTRIFLYGAMLLGVGILLLRAPEEPGDLPLLAVAGLMFSILGLVLSAGAAFHTDP